MKEIGFKSHRTSIQWSRLMPDGETVNPKAAAFYSNFIDCLLEKGIIPMMNLYHFDMPMWLQEKGGLLSFEFIDKFTAYAKTCFELFGDRVEYFTTFNEPIVPVEAGYLYGNHYPLDRDFKKAVQAGYNTVIASSKAIKAFKAMKLPGKIGIILNLSPTYPKDDAPENAKSAHMADLFFNRSFLEPSIKGFFPEDLVETIGALGITPRLYPGWESLLQRNRIDFLGVNYYFPRRVAARTTIWKETAPMPEMFYEDYILPGRKMNPYRGWEIYEPGMYHIAMTIKNEYGNIPWYVSENGMGVEGEERFLNSEGRIDDDYRIEFQKEHLKWLHKGMEEGSHCFGYHNWAFVDNWSWTNAYKNRYGFVALDLNSQKRTRKKSSYFMEELIQNNFMED